MLIMRNLPEKVSDDTIEEMFAAADLDRDGRIGYLEFSRMILPAKSLEP